MNEAEEIKLKQTEDNKLAKQKQMVSPSSGK